MNRTLAAALATLVAWAISIACVAWWFYGAGKDAEVATQSREDKASAKAAQVAASAAAGEIAKLGARNGPIKQAIVREIIERPVFRDCHSGPDAVRLLNAAAGYPAAPNAPGSGVVPASKQTD